MIAEMIERLTRRKVEVARQEATVWQALVIDVGDGKEIDADAVLSDLDRLNRTPGDLATAVELLNQRRAWAASVAAGVRGEADLPAVKRKIADENAKFEAIERQHEEALQPLSYHLGEAGRAILDGASAARELSRTATCPMALQAVTNVEKRLSELRREQAHTASELDAKESRLKIISSQQDPDLQPQVQRLTSDIASMRKQLATFGDRVQELTAEHDAARLRLLSPEAI